MRPPNDNSDPDRQVPPAVKGRTRAVRAVVVIVAASLVGPAFAAADSEIGEARRRRDEVRDEQAAAAAALDLLNAEYTEVATAAAGIEAAVAAQAAQVDAARLALDAAEAEVARQVAYGASLTQAIDLARLDARDRAVEAFVGVAVQQTDVWMGDSDPNLSARMVEYLRVTNGSYEDAFDRLRALEQLQQEVVDAAGSARSEADGLRLDLEDALVQLEVRLDTQRQVQAEVESRVAQAESEVAELEAEEEAIENEIEAAIIAAIGSLRAPSQESLRGFGRPAAGNHGSGFGLRMHPILNYSRPHNGIDISGSTGDPVWAAKDGTVFFAGPRGGFGNCVIIDHGDGVMTVYAHLSQIHVSVGNSVDKGEAIGEIGTTGLSTGPHLHFEVRVNGQAQDPLIFLPL